MPRPRQWSRSWAFQKALVPVRLRGRRWKYQTHRAWRPAEARIVAEYDSPHRASPRARPPGPTGLTLAALQTLVLQPPPPEFFRWLANPAAENRPPAANTPHGSEAYGRRREVRPGCREEWVWRAGTSSLAGILEL